MTKRLRNVEDARAWEAGTGSDGQDYRFVDLSGEHIGVRIEAMPPGGSSSVHHFHTAEEEHVLMLEGDATLVLGADEHVLQQGDHIWFKAGEEIAHHLENRTAKPCRFLVFGERIGQDVVVYPEHQVMLVKGLGRRQVTYRAVAGSARPDDDT